MQRTRFTSCWYSPPCINNRWFCHFIQVRTNRKKMVDALVILLFSYRTYTRQNTDWCFIKIELS